ncbi:MAG: alkaline phosphatase family protein [Rhodospirillales bacterium]|nr:alkaline phosphatase family protein [Rhodospirillales bacterium]
MGAVRNILFIMSDQLRWDYLSHTGHPSLETPNIDSLTRRGVTFERTYVQASVCGPARMSYYTGRYVTSHRSIWNYVPLPVSELTLGDYLRPAGMRVALTGKTHMAHDLAGMERIGIDPASERGVLLSECGFEPFDRDDGLYHQGLFPKLETNYANYLRAKGYDSPNPWHDFANSAEGPGGEILSGWSLRNARLPARVAEADSETAYTTDRAIQFISEQGEAPWCLHLSYIKPHWPYMAPAPYNDMYGPADVKPVRRRPEELTDPHPVYAAFMEHEESVAFRRAEVRETVIPTYMGMIKQIDDHLGRLFKVLEAQGRMDDTLIIFTSDHGDYLGDHYLGEKELFHEEIIRVPFILADPDPAADGTRGKVVNELVESIDLVPTCLAYAGLEIPNHILEGRSLMPFLRGSPPDDWRDAVFCEVDYSFRHRTRTALGRPIDGCRAFMVRTDRWKYVFYEGFPAQLFDLENDPDEFHDLGRDAAHQPIRDEMHERLFTWFRNLNCRQGSPDETVASWTERSETGGQRLGIW